MIIATKIWVLSCLGKTFVAIKRKSTFIIGSKRYSIRQIFVWELQSVCRVFVNNFLHSFSYFIIINLCFLEREREREREREKDGFRSRFSAVAWNLFFSSCQFFYSNLASLQPIRKGGKENLRKIMENLKNWIFSKIVKSPADEIYLVVRPLPILGSDIGLWSEFQSPRL